MTHDGVVPAIARLRRGFRSRLRARGSKHLRRSFQEIAAFCRCGLAPSVLTSSGVRPLRVSTGLCRFGSSHRGSTPPRFVRTRASGALVARSRGRRVFLSSPSNDTTEYCIVYFAYARGHVGPLSRFISSVLFVAGVVLALIILTCVLVLVHLVRVVSLLVPIAVFVLAVGVPISLGTCFSWAAKHLPVFPPLCLRSRLSSHSMPSWRLLFALAVFGVRLIYLRSTWNGLARMGLGLAEGTGFWSLKSQ